MEDSDSESDSEDEEEKEERERRKKEEEEKERKKKEAEKVEAAKKNDEPPPGRFAHEEEKLLLTENYEDDAIGMHKQLVTDGEIYKVMDKATIAEIYSENDRRSVRDYDLEDEVLGMRARHARLFDRRDIDVVFTTEEEAAL